MTAGTGVETKPPDERERRMRARNRALLLLLLALVALFYVVTLVRISGG